jgi:hypothetical protein
MFRSNYSSTSDAKQGLPPNKLDLTTATRGVDPSQFFEFENGTILGKPGLEPEEFSGRAQFWAANAQNENELEFSN